MVERDTSRRVGALLVVGAPSLVGLSIAADFWYLTLGYAVGAVLLVGLLVALHRGRTTSRDILRVLVGLGLFLFALVSWSIVEQQATPLETGYFVFRSVVLVSGVAFVAFRPRTAVLISLGLIACGGALLAVRGVTLIGGSDLRVGVVETLALLLAMVAIHRSMSVEAERMEQSAEAATISAELAFVDELTGLPNRRQMQSLLAAGLARTAAGAHPDAVLMFDLDHFKGINDRYGHPAGDEVIRTLARVLKQESRSGDITARIGGEEFVVLLPQMQTANAASTAERMRRAVEAETVEAGCSRIRFTISIGVVGEVSPYPSKEKIMSACDGALYAAKRDGRNRVVSDSPAAVSNPAPGLDFPFGAKPAV